MNYTDPDTGPTPCGDERELEQSSDSLVTLETENRLKPQSRRHFIKAALIATGAMATKFYGQPVANAQESLIRVHTVRAGETLATISRQYSLPPERIRAINDMPSIRVHAGQRLLIPVAQPKHTLSKTDLKDPDQTVAAADQQELILVSSTGYTLIQPYLKKINQVKIAPRWKHIILHHSGTQNGSARIFDRYHRNERKMRNGLAYHFVVGNGSASGVGEIETSERWHKQLQGGHVRSNAFNQNSIGICMVGNFQERRPHKKQLATTMELIDYLSTQLIEEPVELLLHRDIQSTVCPGKMFPEDLVKHSVA